MKELSTSKELINRDMYDYYRANRKKVAKEIDQYKLWVKAMNGLLIVLKRMVCENENGVYIQGFGYIRAEKNSKFKKRISILKKEERNRYRILFTADNKAVQKRFKFTVGRCSYVLDNTKNYENKIDTILYKVNLTKTKWKK